jgi:hypothetical protein
MLVVQSVNERTVLLAETQCLGIPRRMMTVIEIIATFTVTQHCLRHLDVEFDVVPILSGCSLLWDF